MVRYNLVRARTYRETKYGSTYRCLVTLMVHTCFRYIPCDTVPTKQPRASSSRRSPTEKIHVPEKPSSSSKFTNAKNTLLTMRTLATIISLGLILICSQGLLGKISHDVRFRKGGCLGVLAASGTVGCTLHYISEGRSVPRTRSSLSIYKIFKIFYSSQHSVSNFNLLSFKT